jgi:hypothetical protein
MSWLAITIMASHTRREIEMTLYAIHLAWVDGHAAKAPVGIWGEGGMAFYPAEMEGHREGGTQAETEAPLMSWRSWVEKRVEWGSTYGASWAAIESAQPMSDVLTQLQTEFFAVAHPVKKIFVPIDEAEEDFDDHKEDSELPQANEPALRFVLAQSWWIAAELARRHPELVVHEMHPGGGQYDVLAVSTLPFAVANERVMLNRAGSLQVHGGESNPHMTHIGSWADVMGAENPHAVVKRIETVAQLRTIAKAPPSTPRVLAYRFIATLLSATLNDRFQWDARNEFLDSSGVVGLNDSAGNGFLSAFPEALRDARAVSKVGLPQEPESHFWAVLRDHVPVAIVSIEGRIYLHDRHFNLADQYAATGRRMLPVVATVLSELLP